MSLEDITIYTASSVTGAASHPTLDCLQWTGDGQLLFSTKSSVYILVSLVIMFTIGTWSDNRIKTPDLGLNCRGSPAARASMYRRDGSAHEIQCGWFRTVLEFDKRSFYHWPSDSHEWDSLVTGSLDVSIKSVVVSPSFLSVEAGCVLAIISTNLELSLWCSVKNEPAGPWSKLQDATPFLRSLAAIRSSSHHEQTLRAQVLCSSWSTQPDFGVSPAYVSDSSLLALGNKAGSILLLSFKKKEGASQHLEHVQTVDVSEQWVTHLTWLPWIMKERDECTTLLVYCTSDGAVGFVKVSRIWSTTTGASQPTLTTRANHLDLSICKANDLKVMGLTFIEPQNMKPIVVLLRPGIVQLWNEQNNGGAWSGLRTFQLDKQDISSGSSRFYPPSGLIYSPEHDALVLSLFDGSFHVIHCISSSPTFTPPAAASKQDRLAPRNLSLTARKVFVQVEGNALRHMEMNRISGMVSFADYPIVCWTHERSVSSDFSYKHEARHSSTLVVTKMHTEDSDDAVMRILAEVILMAKAFSGTTPTHLLRPLLFRLGQDGALTRLHPHLLRALHSPVVDDCVELKVSPSAGEFSSPTYGEFSESVTHRLFGSDTLLRLRLMLAIADFCWESAPSPEMRSEYGEVKRYLLSTISHNILRAIVRQIDSVVHLLSTGDLLFVLRVVVQCMLPGTPPELSVEAETLSKKATSLFPSCKEANGSLLEKCPACGVEVPLTDTASAVCSNGHRWSRCSITSFILAGTMVRTCLGCARKASLPAGRSPYRPEGGGDVTADMSASTRNTAEDALMAEDLDASGWLVQALLKAVRRCLFCGNNFATLI